MMVSFLFLKTDFILLSLQKVQLYNPTASDKLTGEGVDLTHTDYNSIMDGGTIR